MHTRQPGHAPDELVDGVLWDLLPDLDQGISKLLDSLVLVLGSVGCNDTQPQTCAQLDLGLGNKSQFNSNSEDFLPVPSSSPGTVGYGMEVCADDVTRSIMFAMASPESFTQQYVLSVNLLSSVSVSDSLVRNMHTSILLEIIL